MIFKQFKGFVMAIACFSGYGKGNAGRGE